MRVSIIYHHFPHYRAPVMRELARSGSHEYRFFGSLEQVSGIKAFQGDEEVRITPLRFSLKGSRWVLKGYWPAVLDRSADALIILGNPNMPASWVIAAAGRLVGKKVLFWAHGWLKPEPPLKRFIRNFYYRLAHRTLVYGERATIMAQKAGFPAGRIRVIYNSLDHEKALQALARVERGETGDIPRPQSLFEDPSRPLVICSARITHLCRFDLLFEATTILQKAGRPLNILLVGDGPERQPLEALAEKLGIDVHFYGACYDEDILANLTYYSDMTVSPGKIGLTVIQSLTYGTPAITHGDLDEQMPEVEAIEPGKSGLLFERNNAKDLARSIDEWLARGIPRQQVREDCQKVIADKWNPVRQRQLIDAAIDELLPHRESR